MLLDWLPADTFAYPYPDYGDLLGYPCVDDWAPVKDMTARVWRFDVCMVQLLYKT
jgi:hypothetical protein